MNIGSIYKEVVGRFSVINFDSDLLNWLVDYLFIDGIDKLFVWWLLINWVVL